LAHELISNPFGEYVHPDDAKIIKKYAIEGSSRFKEFFKNAI
jgi:hypothetical protein